MYQKFAAAALALGAAQSAGAGGIDRLAQTTDIIFRDGNFAELGVARTVPDVTGTDLPSPLPSQFSYDNVADAYNNISFGVKYDLSNQFSLAFTGQEDFGSDITYDGSPTASLLGGTSAIADTYTLALLARYKFTDNISVHGGVRAQRADGTIKLNGLAYGGTTIVGPTGLPLGASTITALTGGARTSNAVSGYSVDLDQDWGYGYAVGAAYEIPELALRFSVTYNSKIEHDFDTDETFTTSAAGNTVSFDGSTTDVDLPQSVNVNFQTGVAEDTLVFANYRWVDWSQFRINPEEFTAATNAQLVTVDTAQTYELGVGRRFTPAFAARVSVIRDIVDGDNLVSPLSPTKGYTALALAGSYRVANVEYAAGVRYFWLGDAQPETGTPDVARATFTDNTAVAFGVRVGVYF